MAVLGATHTSLIEKTYNPLKAEQFSGRLMQALNDGALCLMISIGHRTGLFDTMRNLPPSTPREIAEAAGLDERYVREWLGAMTTSRVVEVDGDMGRFRLPREHADFLTRSASADNIGLFSQYIGLLGGVEDDIVNCFKYGGGVHYSRFPRFHEIMSEDSGQSVLSSLEEHILPLIPGMQDRLRKGIQVLDLGCGRGRILVRMAELFPASQFTGIDLSEEAITFARVEAYRKGLTNLTFEVGDLTNFDLTSEPQSYDFITTFDAVHDQPQPLNLLRGIFYALRSGGVYLMQDISGSSHVHRNIEHPIGTLLYTISCMHCMTVSLAQGGEGLGAMWGEEKTHEYLRRAGFTTVQTNKLAHDIQNNWYVVRR